MTAKKLTEAVSEVECDKKHTDIRQEIASLRDAIIGVPGDTSRCGIMGMLTKQSILMEQLTKEVGEITTEHFAMQIMGLKAEIDANTLEMDRLTTANEQFVQASNDAPQITWLKITMAMLTICTATMGLAGAVVILLKVKFG